MISAPADPDAGSATPEQLSPAAREPEGGRELTEHEAGFMVLPLGIVPRQQDRKSAEANDKPELAGRVAGVVDSSGVPLDELDHGEKIGGVD